MATKRGTYWSEREQLNRLTKAIEGMIQVGANITQDQVNAGLAAYIDAHPGFARPSNDELIQLINPLIPPPLPALPPLPAVGPTPQALAAAVAAYLTANPPAPGTPGTPGTNGTTPTEAQLIALINPAVNAAVAAALANSGGGGGTQPPAGTQLIRSHPGVYVLLDTPIRESNKAAAWSQHQSRMTAQANLLGSALDGWKILPMWAALEGNGVGLANDESATDPNRFSSGIAMIQQYVNHAKSLGKRIMISFQTTWFGGVNPSDLSDHFPSYIWKNPSGLYGVRDLANGQSGKTAKIDQTATADKIIEMIQAYGAAFKNEDAVEAIQIEETSVSNNDPTFTQAGLVTQYTRIYAAARAAWPNTILRLCLNYCGSNDMTAGFIAGAGMDSRLAIAGPDTYTNQSQQGHRIFCGTPIIAGHTSSTTNTTWQSSPLVDYRGVLGSFSEIQSPEIDGIKQLETVTNLLNAMFDGYSYGSPAVQARPMKPSHVIITEKSFGAGQQWTTGISAAIAAFDRSRLNQVYPTRWLA